MYQSLEKQFPLIPKEQFKHITALDPTFNEKLGKGKYTKWILTLLYPTFKNKKLKKSWNELMKKYPDGINPKTHQPFNKPKLLEEVPEEDWYKIPNLIAGYEENKKWVKLPIDKFTTLPALSKSVSDAIQKGKDVTNEEIKKRNIIAFNNAKKDGLKVVYEDNSWIIGISTTFKSSSHFKKPVTDWCTAYSNMYEKYTKKGNLYIHLNKETGKLSQLTFENFAFMDSFDNSIDAPSFFKENPQLKKFYEPIILNNDKFLIMPENWKFVDKKYITEQIQLEAVKQNGWAIQYIIKLGITPSEKVQLAVVKQNGYAIDDIIKGGIIPSEQVQLEAVKQNGLVIEYIIKAGITPTEEMQLEAVKQNGNTIKYIIKAGITPTEEMQLEAVKQNGNTIKYIIKAGITPTEEMQLEAVKQNGTAIFYIIEAGITPSEQVQLAAVKQDGYAIKYIIELGIKPSEQVQLAAVTQKGSAIYYIIEGGITPSEQLQLVAVTQEGWVIKYIIEGEITPSEKVQLAAVKQNPTSFDYIKNPSPKVIKLYRKLSRCNY